MNESILDHKLLTERYFFPRKEPFDNPFWVEVSGGDFRLSCYYYNKHPEAKTVIYFHGNGEEVSDTIRLFVPVFQQMETNLFLAEYRGYGMSGGTPALSAMLADLEPIIRATGQPPEKLVLFGRSIGSLYAVHGVSLFPNISGLIIESGISNLLERVLMRAEPEQLGLNMQQLQALVDKEFNHKQKLSEFKGSTMVLHALHDSMVSSDHGKQLFEWAPHPKVMKLFDKGDHNDIFFVNADEYFKLVYQFIAQLP